jgi:4-amino-4-deoxy-L-arabinose transferase-like glycosyltransferase
LDDYHESIGRLLSIIFSLIAIYFFYKLCLEITCDKKIAFWSSFFYTIIPTNIYYSRTFQPESLVLMSAISGTYFFYKWIKDDQKKNFFISSLLICLACLVKVVPALYLFLPLTYLVWQKFKYKMFSNLNLYLYASIIIVPTFAWYFHSYQVANEYGLSFGFGVQKFALPFNRLGIIVEQFIYFITVRHLLVLGFIAMIFGIFCKRKTKEEIFFNVFFMSSIIYLVIIADIASLHEYYQLPLLIPASIYTAKAFISFRHKKKIVNIGLIFFLFTALIFYSLEYIDKENPNSSELFELAQIIKKRIPKDSLIIVTTGGDPTLLYLSHKKGWIVSPNIINQVYLSDRIKDGAKYLVGGYNFVQTYTTSMKDADKKKIQEIVAQSPSQILNSNKFFLIKL